MSFDQFNASFLNTSITFFQKKFFQINSIHNENRRYKEGIRYWL